jgi:hypothetical protein
MRHSTAVIAQARRSIRGAIQTTTSSAQARPERGIWPRREAVAKRNIFVAATAAAWLIAYAAPVAAQAPALLPNPQIKIDYLQPKNISTASDPTQYNRYMTIYAWLGCGGRSTRYRNFSHRCGCLAKSRFKLTPAVPSDARTYPEARSRSARS